MSFLSIQVSLLPCYMVCQYLLSSQTWTGNATGCVVYERHGHRPVRQLGAR